MCQIIDPSVKNDICSVNCWLEEPVGYKRTDYFSTFSGDFTYENRMEFAEKMAATGKYFQIVFSYSDSN